ncbi:alpha/beta fold hydrolase [Enterobacter asburiae]|uniref:alpha/beta fold hydrolase n=1 Tax=Enterobacter asburiae TaxID=61645 RepID=UPI001CBFA04E|nr:alpha/beta fold hydrolase [Enterobacter asburiae]UAN35133.1 alpha/beta fold hydrolase [Enterobacter asburiae]
MKVPEVFKCKILTFFLIFFPSAYGEVNSPSIGQVSVVFESAMGDGEEVWKEIKSVLSQCTTVVTYNRYETQLKNKRKIIADDVAKNLQFFLENKSIKPPYIMVGHSLGGLYAQAFTRNYPNQVSGLILIDATSPLEPEGLFESKSTPKAGSYVSLEYNGIRESIKNMNFGPSMPNIPLVVFAANEHQDTIEHENIWQDTQRKTARLSTKGKYIVVDTHHYIQKSNPEIIIKSILDMVSEKGGDISSCVKSDFLRDN